MMALTSLVLMPMRVTAVPAHAGGPVSIVDASDPALAGHHGHHATVGGAGLGKADGVPGTARSADDSCCTTWYGIAAPISGTPATVAVFVASPNDLPPDFAAASRTNPPPLHPPRA